MKKLTWILAALLGAALAQAQDLSKPAIVVNGTPITFRTYYHRMETLNGFGRRVGDSFVPAAPGFLTLQQIINETLMISLAKDKGVHPSAQEIEDEYAALLKESPEKVAASLKFGTTAEDIKQTILVRLCEFKLQTMGVNISDQQIDTFYKENPGIYTTPKTLDVYAIAVETPEAQDAVDKKLNSNANFPDVAKEHSVDLSKSIGGYLGRLIESTLPPQLKKQLEGLKAGETSAWVDAGARKYKYFVEKVYPEKLAPLSPELRDAIRQRLMVERGKIRNDLNAWMAAKRTGLKLEFQGTQFDDAIKQAFIGGQ